MKVHIVKYNLQWPKMFEQEAANLRNHISNGIHAIHHIGSTSVPNLAAKPIIDILLEVENLLALDSIQHRFEQLGYESMGEYGILRRRYYRKGGDNRTHQIHAFQIGDFHVTRHLAFRDYLIYHPPIAKEYAATKIQSAKLANNSKESYCDLKDPFIARHEPLAIRWYQNAKACL